MREGAHRRQNLLTGDWVLVSPHRLKRPWQGAETPPVLAPQMAHDPGCYLCPGNARAEGVRNPAYEGVFVFDNDFPALLADAPALAADPVLVAQPETGVCRVVCYSPNHSRTMAQMTPEEIAQVVRVWGEETRSLLARPDIQSVFVFENRGEMMGASNPHPHGQIWATASQSNEFRRVADRQAAWMHARGTALLSDYLERELAEDRRVVVANAGFVVLVPFWAAWPFETLVLPRRAVASLDRLSGAEQAQLAEALSAVTRTYDAVFDAPFPYTMGWRQAPKGAADGFVLHGHFYPPLLRSASVRKFMVGFEMLGMPQRDLTPEAAADRLKAARAKIGA